MPDEGKYLYCIIEEGSHRSFGPIGIGKRGDEVHTLCYRDLACVLSSTPMTKYVISRDNLIAHEKVIEKAMKDYTVLPIRFCTIATSIDEVRSLLMKRYQEFKNLLRSMDNKVELGLKAFWLNMDAIFREIGVSDKKINLLKEKLQKMKKNPSMNEKVILGEKVKKVLEEKRKAEAEEVIQTLEPKCIHLRLNETVGDNMLFNSVFLVDRMQEPEFDDLVDNLTEKYRDRLLFKYVGPTPPFNFVNLTIEWGAEG